MRWLKIKTLVAQKGTEPLKGALKDESSSNSHSREGSLDRPKTSGTLERAKLNGTLERKRKGTLTLDRKNEGQDTPESNRSTTEVKLRPALRSSNQALNASSEPTVHVRKAVTFDMSRPPEEIEPIEYEPETAVRPLGLKGALLAIVGKSRGDFGPPVASRSGSISKSPESSITSAVDVGEERAGSAFENVLGSMLVLHKRREKEGRCDDDALREAEEEEAESTRLMASLAEAQMRVVATAPRAAALLRKLSVSSNSTGFTTLEKGSIMGSSNSIFKGRTLAIPGRDEEALTVLHYVNFPDLPFVLSGSFCLHDTPEAPDQSPKEFMFDVDAVVTSFASSPKCPHDLVGTFSLAIRPRNRDFLIPPQLLASVDQTSVVVQIQLENTANATPQQTSAFRISANEHQANAVGEVPKVLCTTNSGHISDEVLAKVESPPAESTNLDGPLQFWFVYSAQETILDGMYHALQAATGTEYSTKSFNISGCLRFMLLIHVPPSDGSARSFSEKSDVSSPRQSQASRFPAIIEDTETAGREHPRSSVTRPSSVQQFRRRKSSAVSIGGSPRSSVAERSSPPTKPLATLSAHLGFSVSKVFVLPENADKLIEHESSNQLLLKEDEKGGGEYGAGIGMVYEHRASVGAAPQIEQRSSSKGSELMSAPYPSLSRRHSTDATAKDR
ncbi:hypothetical protein BJ742DRAFT_308743 [Cladochytrium replicatum]|nr:hypothetical protein BJ742DRAFT_308743 [Cladochytrium replicatum]